MQLTQHPLPARVFFFNLLLLLCWVTELNSVLSETRIQSTWRAVDAIAAIAIDATADIIYSHFSHRFSFFALMFLLSLKLTCFEVDCQMKWAMGLGMRVRMELRLGMGLGQQLSSGTN